MQQLTAYLIDGLKQHMLFNSYAFIFVFFPIVFVVFFRIGKFNHLFASFWLAAASLFFYGWWDKHFVGLMLGSIVFNYSAGYLIAVHSSSKSKILLTCAIVVNLTLLGYFKYANFFVENINNLANTSLTIGNVILPLGISFFTFTQIAFLVDTYQGKVKEFNFIRYLLFVTYFPHLIAGPVLHHQEMMPQFAKPSVCYINWGNVAVGFTIFVLGLAKKILIADAFAEISTPIFDAVKMGGNPMLLEAWIGALAYTLQLYFDFSAYSDMAIGISLMFNVRLPMNFNSPYKATSIIEFWRCWHMTLSRFLRDYLYIPLGGNRYGKAQRHLNMMITMLLGGLWHGAGWTFVIWGGLHGFYLMINHSWRSTKGYMGWGSGGLLTKLAAGLLTFLAVVVGWVFFRADSVSSAMSMLNGMMGMNASISSSLIDKQLPLTSLNIGKTCRTLSVGFLIVWLLPNMRQIFSVYRPVCEDMTESASSVKMIKEQSKLGKYLQWRPNGGLAWVTGILLAFVVMRLTHISEFLYFRF